MSLPPSYDSAFHYFQDALLFLEEFAWIYKTSNTKFVVDGVLDKFPPEWTQYFTSVAVEELNKFPRGGNLDNLPESLNCFRKRLQLLTPTHNVLEMLSSDIYIKGASPKKLHEISRLSSVISHTCQNNVDIIVDFGSGLGYLSEVLYRENNFKILGLECDPARCKSAREKQEKHFSSSKGKVFFKEALVTEQSFEFIEDSVGEICEDIENPKLAIVGLHACADLSITSVKLFLTMKNASKLIVMPCCYHKLRLCENSCTNNLFENFPVSGFLSKAAAALVDLHGVLSRPFLRLACQQTVSRWIDMGQKEHSRHGKEMLIRGVVECLAGENECISKRGKGIELDELSINDTGDVLSYIETCYQIHQKGSKGAVEWNEQHRKNLCNILSKYESSEKLAEGLTCLQTSLQELCENLVLLDRVCYINEYSQQHDLNVNVCLQKITDDKISPRCFAFIAEKIDVPNV